MPPSPRRFHLGDQARGQARTHKEARTVDRAAGIHRQCPGRAESLVDQKIKRVATAQAQAGGRSLLRPFCRRALSPRHQDAALASRQVAEAVHDGASQAEEGGFAEAAEIAFVALTPYTGVVPLAWRTAPAR